ncbi:hypothetical protein AB1Y20_006047 [Prymnesium parvum]|uniref:TRPM SLOG domain-containing protein n=1 Tax=Prymnesium parvum TaxID=97485 RepID=A0AB34J3U2_PRYPA
MAEMSRVAEAVLVDRPQEGTPKGPRFSRQLSNCSRTLGRIRRQSKLVASLHSYQNEVMEKAAIVLQRALRVRWQVYRLFGPELFFDAYGQSGQSGAIAFAGCANPSFWIRVSHNSAPSRLVEFLVHFWQITRPEIIISITGGAQDFTMHHQLRGAFERGLAKASISAKSMIFTAGSDTGVMKLVGAAKQRHGIEAPLIGIFPWGATNGREQLMRNCGTIAWYKPTPPSKEGAPLNPHHTHFIFVDDGTENSASWGSEIQMRSKIESTLSTVKSVPVVVLVVQGGPGTLATVLSAARSAKPITILADSGGAATALFTFVTQGADALEERFVPYSDTMREIHELNELYEGRQLKFFRLEDGVADVTGTGQRDICETLLEGIIDMIGTMPASQLLPVGARVADATRGEGKVVKRESNGARWVEWESTGETVRYEAQGMEAFTFAVPTGSWHQQSEEVGSPLLAKALNLCVAWDMPQMVGRVLASSYRVRNVSPVQGVGSLPEVGQALQRALELQHSGVAQLLWDLPGTSFKAVNMCKLYLKTAPHRSLESKQLQFNLRIAANLEIKQKLSYTARHKVFVESLQSTFHAVNNVLAYSLHMFPETRAHDIFLWLMFQGNCSFAKKVWSHCDRPVHIALLGTAICRKLESQSELVYNDVSLGDTVENWAYGAMEMSPSEARSRQVLELSLLENKPSNALDIAYAVAAKHFLTQRSVAAYIDLGWRGGFEDPIRAPHGTKETVITLPAKFSWLSIAIQTMCPFLCPQVYLKSPEEEKTEYHDMTLLRALSLKAHLTKTEARNSRPSVSPVSSSPRTRLRVQGWRYADVRFGDASHSAWNTEITTSLLKDARRILVPSEILKTGTADFRKRWFVVQEGESQRFHIYDMFMWLHEVMQPFAAFYKIPAVRLVNRAMVHVIGICLHCAMVLSFSSFHELDGLKSSSPRLPVMRFHWNNGDPIEFIWWCFELCIGLDSTHHRLIKVQQLRINTTSRTSSECRLCYSLSP